MSAINYNFTVFLKHNSHLAVDIRLNLTMPPLGLCWARDNLTRLKHRI